MSERLFLFFIGSYILAALYLDLDVMIYVLCTWLLLEAISDLRITTLSQKIMHTIVPAGLTVFQTHQRFDFYAFCAWRLVVAVTLGSSFILVRDYNIDV